MPSPPRTLGIAGVGLIGASIGLRARELGWRVLGCDPAAAHLAGARERGALDGTTASLRELGDAAEVLVLAAPLDVTLAQLAELCARPPQAALVLDVASVKTPVSRAGAGLAAFVATHPIAGSEKSGPAFARADLFADRIWTYDPAAPRAAVSAVRTFIAALGGRPLALASGEHDRIVALTSHVPQVVSVALGARLDPHLGDPNVAALCGTGMRSMLRLSASSWTMWRAILGANAAAVAQEVRTLAGVLGTVADALESGETDDLGRDFDAAARAVARLNANAEARSSVEPPMTAHETEG